MSSSRAQNAMTFALSDIASVIGLTAPLDEDRPTWQIKLLKRHLGGTEQVNADSQNIFPREREISFHFSFQAKCSMTTRTAA